MPMDEKYARKAPRKKTAPRKSRASEPVAIFDPSDETEAEIAVEVPAEHYQSHAKKVVAGNFANILDRMAKEAVEGSLSHTKYLFEIGGVKEDIERLGQEAEPSLVDLFHEEIRKQRAAEEARRREAAEGMAEVNAGTYLTEESSADCGAKPQ
jgi:predicted transcriptional regulator